MSAQDSPNAVPPPTPVPKTIPPQEAEALAGSGGGDNTNVGAFHKFYEAHGGDIIQVLVFVACVYLMSELSVSEAAQAQVISFVAFWVCAVLAVWHILLKHIPKLRKYFAFRK